MDTQTDSSSTKHANPKITAGSNSAPNDASPLGTETPIQDATVQITAGFTGLTLDSQKGENSQQEKNSQGENHSQESDVPTGLVTSFRTPAGTKFCRDCIYARNDPAYAKRIKDTLSRRRCSACERKHGGFLFSGYQRHRKDEERVCIGAEGLMSVCPHTTLSLKDMDNFIDKHPKDDEEPCAVLSCPHEPCASLNLRIEYRYNPISEGGQQSVFIEWRTEIKSDSNRDWKEQVVEKATELVENHGDLFCPHIRAVPARFGDTSSIVRNRRTCLHNEKFQMGCFSCDQAIYFDGVDSQANGAPIRLRGWRRVKMDTEPSMRGCHWRWLSNIEPDSFDLHRDMETINISWCEGGPACATNYGYLHYTELLFNAAQPKCEFSAAVFNEEPCVPYQPYMDRGDGPGVHSIDCKAAKMQRCN